MSSPIFRKPWLRETSRWDYQLQSLCSRHAEVDAAWPSSGSATVFVSIVHAQLRAMRTNRVSPVATVNWNEMDPFVSLALVLQPGFSCTSVLGRHLISSAVLICSFRWTIRHIRSPLRPSDDTPGKASLRLRLPQADSPQQFFLAPTHRKRRPRRRMKALEGLPPVPMISSMLDRSTHDGEPTRMRCTACAFDSHDLHVTA